MKHILALLVVAAVVGMTAASIMDTRKAMKEWKATKHAAAKAGETVAEAPKLPQNGSGEYQYTINRPEGPRQFWAWVPEGYDPNTPVPLLFTFHGLGDDCYSFGHNSGLINQSSTFGFILVYPCGYPGLLGNAWNAGTCCLDGYSIDDVQFTRDMAAFMVQNWAIDQSRIFTSGFSNGAFMTEILLCEASDLFLAGAGVSGIVELLPGNSEGEANCDKDYAAVGKFASLLHIHGNFDFVVPWTGDMLLGFPDVPTDYADWGTRNQCVGQPVNTFNNGPYSNQVYQNCASNTTMELVKHDGGGHEWPSDQYFDTPSYIWAYLSKVAPRS